MKNKLATWQFLSKNANCSPLLLSNGLPADAEIGVGDNRLEAH